MELVFDVSSTPVVLGDVLNDWLRHTWTSKTTVTEESDAVFEIKHKHANLVESLMSARVNKLMISIIMHKENTHLQVIPQQSTQNTANLPLQACEKTSRPFLLNDTGIDFSSRNNFANFNSLCIVPINRVPCSNPSHADSEVEDPESICGIQAGS